MLAAERSKWTEDYLVGGSGGVTVSAGTFDVNLGAHNPFASQVDWNQDTLYLSFQVGNTSSCTIITNFQTNCTGDGEMTPYIRLTAVPYAMNANKVGGLTASQLVQLTPAGGTQTGTIDVSGNIKSGATVQANTIDSATSGSFNDRLHKLNQSGPGRQYFPRLRTDLRYPGQQCPDPRFYD